MRTREIDVLVIGGGPAGSSTAAILRRYNPALRVVVVEQAEFPRYHIGESLVLEVNRVLEDMGCLDEVASAGFLKKGGASYVWGADRRPWSLLFAEASGKRPHYDGIIDHTWHVDRARFDTILLDAARRAGVEVMQPARVTDVGTDDSGRVVGADVMGPDGEPVRFRARYTVDASGRSGVIARRFGRRIFDPILRNVATFGYWTGAHLDPDYAGDWDLSRTTVVTLPTGWAWYIPIERGTASVGVVTPPHALEGYKGNVEAFYLEQLQSVPELRSWLADATLDSFPHTPRKVMVERDFNYMHSTLWGKGHALVGDAAGFLDPLFTFGVFLATTGGQLLAYALGTLLDDAPDTADEARLLGAYEQHMRGYMDAFGAMLYVFYGFNTTKEAFWKQTRSLLRSHALPDDVDDREAFMAATFGYGVNTLLFEEATGVFGAHARHLIGEMLRRPADGSGPAEVTGPGPHHHRPLSPTARPHLCVPYRTHPSFVPLRGQGRVAAMTRVELEIGSDDEARFPRYVFLPDALLPLLDDLDGETEIAALRARWTQALPAYRDPNRGGFDFLDHLLASLSGMGAISGIEEPAA